VNVDKLDGIAVQVVGGGLHSGEGGGSGRGEKAQLGSAVSTRGGRRDDWETTASSGRY